MATFAGKCSAILLPKRMKLIEKPRADEYPAYAVQYIGLLPDDGRLLEHFATNLTALKSLLCPLSESELLHRYAEGKWTIKEVIGHIIDDERIYVYRALCFARGDPTQLPGFDQDQYALHSGANRRSMEDLLEELSDVRAATISFFSNLDEEAWTRMGVANGNRASVRALAYHIAGHELHHVNIIRERYLK